MPPTRDLYVFRHLQVDRTGTLPPMVMMTRTVRLSHQQARAIRAKAKRMAAGYGHGVAFRLTKVGTTPEDAKRLSDYLETFRSGGVHR